MAGQLAALLDEARALGLFRPQAGIDVHCSNCHTRLDPHGDCPGCGLIGRSDKDVERRAQGDAAGVERALAAAIAKRRRYVPPAKGREERA